MLKRLTKINSSIKMKLLIMSFLFLSIPIITIGVIGYNKTKLALDEQGELRLKNGVEMTIETIKILNEQVEKGHLTLEEAQERAKIFMLGEKDSDGNRPINENIDLGENGYLYVADQNGVLIAHPNIEGREGWEDEDKDGVKFNQEMISVGNSGGGLVHYYWTLPDDDSRTAPKVTYSKTDPYWNWVISGSTYMKDFNHAADNVLNAVYIVIVITLIIGLTTIWIFTHKMARPIQQVTQQMNIVSEGDLSKEAVEVKTKDETGQLANALNFMQSELRKIIGNIVDASHTLVSQSEELTQSAHEVSEGSEQVATTMQELASGAENQAHHASDLSTMMGSFVTKINNINKTGVKVQKSSNEVINLTNNGSQLMEESTKQMEMIDHIVNNAVEKVEGLDRHAKGISDLVSIIHDIAAQTDLLALNAAIEAARAGEHGQGFAVVADEVRKLAEESARSVTSITEIVERIQTESSDVVTSLQHGYKEVEQGRKQIMTTGETFHDISSSLTVMVNNISDVSDSLSEIVVDCEEMNSSIEDIAAISEEAAAGIEETTANTEQANAAMEEISASSNELAQLAEQLNDLIKHFRI